MDFSWLLKCAYLSWLPNYRQKFKDLSDSVTVWAAKVGKDLSWFHIPSYLLLSTQFLFRQGTYYLRCLGVVFVLSLFLNQLILYIPCPPPHALHSQIVNEFSPAFLFTLSIIQLSKSIQSLICTMEKNKHFWILKISELDQNCQSLDWSFWLVPTMTSKYCWCYILFCGYCMVYCFLLILLCFDF